MRKLLTLLVLLWPLASVATETPRNVQPSVAIGPTALGALNATCSVQADGTASAGFQLAAGTLVGNLVPEVSIDNGTTWVATYFDDPATGNKASSLVFTSSNPATTRTIIPAGGMRQVRVRVSAYTSGTANCIITATSAMDPSLLSSSGTNTALPPVAQLIGGEAQNGSQPAAATAGNLRQIVLSTDGVQYTRPGGPVLWHCSLTGVAASLTQCQAAPAAGLSLYITDVFYQTSTTTSGTFAIQAGLGTNCGTTTIPILPASGTSNRFNAAISTAGVQKLNLVTPIKVASSNALCVIGIATNTIDVDMVGFTAP